MTLNIKSDENIKLAQYCIKKEKYLNAAISRIYYAVFQKIKYFLIIKNFDYTAFKIKLSRPNEKDYSHGTLQHAIIECITLNQKSINQNSLYLLNNIDYIYKKRRDADYEEQLFEKKTAEKLFKEANVILKILDDIIIKGK